MQENSEDFKSFFNEAKKYPLLSKNEEQEIGKEMAELRFKIRNCHKDRMYEKAKMEKKLSALESKFINSNLLYLAKLAKKYANNEHSWMDLVNEGYSGLERAVQKFDYKKDCRFSTYATWWIEAPIFKLLGKTPDEDSLDEQLKSKPDRTSHDIIPDKSRNDYQNIVDDISRKETVNRILKKVKLTKNEKKVMLLRLGARGRPLPLKETGNILGISREQVRLIQEGAKIKFEEFPEELQELKEFKELKKVFR